MIPAREVQGPDAADDLEAWTTQRAVIPAKAGIRLDLVIDERPAYLAPEPRVLASLLTGY